MTTDNQKHRANAAVAIALGMEAAANQGVPDSIIADEILRVTLALIGMANGGTEGIPDALERMAADLRDNPAAPPRAIN